MPDGDSEMPVESGETSVMTNRKPRIYLHPDHEHISIGFDDTQDTLLAMPDRVTGWRDHARAVEWAETVSDVLRRDRGRDTLQTLWSLSMHGQCPIWLGGALQHIVMRALDAVDAAEVEDALGNEPGELTAHEAAEIREREDRIVRGEYEVLDP